jgi:glycosyltransferase involved in cell wall biosynthesis
MKICLIHNCYQNPGGETIMAQAEERLLTSAGNDVIEYRCDNGEINDYGTGSKMTLPLRTVWAWDRYNDIKALLERERPGIAHFHNTFPLVSPAAYYACKQVGIPVVQTLHNYRLFCPQATFFRNGKICEECLNHSLWRAVYHGCYRGSRPATASVALMLGVHRRLKTWIRMVDGYIALTEFSRRKFIEGGLPAEKVAVKPNFLDPDPGVRAETGKYALFVGRFSEGKGLQTLLTAWHRLNNFIPLKIVGDGPLRPSLQDEAQCGSTASIDFCGWMSRDQTLEAIKQARFLVFPSEAYEGFGLTIVEAFACGIPVIASQLAATKEIVEDGRTGLHFRPGDAADLAQKVEWAWFHPKEMASMGRMGRAEYEANYTAERNYPMLMEIYERAIASHKAAQWRTDDGGARRHGLAWKEEHPRNFS